MEAGASAYLTKGCPVTELVQAIGTSIGGIKALFPESDDYRRIDYNALRPGHHENLPDGAAGA